MTSINDLNDAEADALLDIAGLQTISGGMSGALVCQAAGPRLVELGLTAAPHGATVEGRSLALQILAVRGLKPHPYISGRTIPI